MNVMLLNKQKLSAQMNAMLLNKTKITYPDEHHTTE